MVAAQPDPKSLVDRLNSWAIADIAIDPAQFRPCRSRVLPTKVKKLAALLHKAHGTLIAENASEEEVPAQEVSDFDPTRDCAYTHYGEERDTHPESTATMAFARAYFAGRTIQLAKGEGGDGGAYPFTFDWLVALDPHTRVVFSFIWNLQD
jgi:hypothetical protein